MDSLTQITLGAAVGELTLGGKVGNKALAWGAVAGTIPDLDVLMTPFLSDVESAAYHRGFSHSIVFALLLAPLLGWAISKWRRKEGASAKDWTKLCFWALVTHPILDCFTTWGTQLFWPFSDYRVAWNSIFIIDPLYTLPFLLLLIILMFLKRSSRARRILCYTGLSVSTAYLLLSVLIKLHINGVFKEALARQNLEYSRFTTNAMPLNIALWHGIVENERGFWLGQYSIFDADKNIDFQYAPKNAHLLEPYENTWEVEKLRWITEGFMTVEKREGGIKINDLRFGMSDAGLIEGDEFVFSYLLHPKTLSADGGVFVTRASGGRPDLGVVLGEVKRRVWGEKRRTPLQLAHKYFQALNRRELEPLISFLHPDLQYENSRQPGLTLKNYVDSLSTASPDAFFDVTQTKVENGWAIVHWQMIDGEFQANSEATNGASSFSGVDSLRVRDGKIVEIKSKT